MARVVLREIVFGLAATGLLMGCVDGSGGTAGSGGATASAKAKASGKVDVEAPDVYQTTDSALWDGRPSLGGIWVAAPDVANPERALIFNPATGKSVAGALFKRERENPGPRLQLSSDAAEALGILAGQPTEIRVTALRKEETKAPESAAPGDSQAPAGDAGGGATGEAAAVASAALAAVEAGTPAPAATDAGAAGTAPTDSTGASADAPAVAADGSVPATEAAPVKKTWKERRAEARAAREAKKRAAAEAKAAAAAAAAAGADALTSAEAPTATAGDAAAAMAPIESAPLDARTPAPAATEGTAKSGRKTVGDAAPAAPSAVAAAPVASEPAAGGAARPIQVASFSKEDNARRAAEALAKIGVTATPQQSDKGGKAVWGVVVMGDDAVLKKIKDAGFADAYYLK